MAKEEELIRFSVLSGKKEFKNYFKNWEGHIPSSLEHLNREIIIVEDGSEIGECCGLRLNFIEFLERYDFDQTLEEPPNAVRAKMKLS